MKTTKIFFALAMSATIVACTPKQVAPETGEDGSAEPVEAVKTLKDYTPSAAEVDSVSYLLGVNFGSFLKGYNFGDVNYSKVIAGMKDYVKAKGDYRDPDFNSQFKISPELINDVLEKTRRFIRRLKVLDLEISSRTYDYLSTMSSITEYGVRNQIPPLLTGHIQLAFEELVHHLILPKLEKPAVRGNGSRRALRSDRRGKGGYDRPVWQRAFQPAPVG